MTDRSRDPKLPNSLKRSEYSLKELSRLSVRLDVYSQQVDQHRGDTLSDTLQRNLIEVTNDLKKFTPGLFAAEIDPDKWTICLKAAKLSKASLLKQQWRDALCNSLASLSIYPQDPEMWHLGGSALFWLARSEVCFAFLNHALFINPGYKAAQTDLANIATVLRSNGQDVPAFGPDTYF